MGRGNWEVCHGETGGGNRRGGRECRGGEAA